MMPSKIKLTNDRQIFNQCYFGHQRARFKDKNLKFAHKVEHLTK